MDFHVVSDLHIDHWDLNLYVKYPHGERKNFPFPLEKNKGILIIAGDISDDLDLSIEFLNKISNFYEKILYIDGNHEHINKYPKLYTTEEIDSKIKNNKINYLRKNHFLHEKTVFLGVSGWWNYCNMDEKIVEKNKEYFKNWFPGVTDELSLDFINNTNSKSIEEFEILKEEVSNYEKDENIENIIIVTHTVPLQIMARKEEIGTDCNTNFEKIIENNKKIKLWIFGHNHSKFDNTINGIRFISNPRGRPNDFDREIYTQQKIVI